MKEPYKGHELEITSEKRDSGLWWASVTAWPPIRGIRSLTLAGPYKSREGSDQGDYGFNTKQEAERAARAWAKGEIDR